MAAFRFLALIWLISSSVRSAEEAGAGSSPFGPLESTLPVTSCSALSACSETPGSDVVVVVDALVQPLKAIRVETARAATAVSLVLFMISSVWIGGWVRVCGYASGRTGCCGHGDVG